MSVLSLPVVYEVDLWVDAAIADEYRAWLPTHVLELLALPGFLDARIFDVLEPVASDNEIALCVQYTLRDRAALDEYLRLHASRLRAEGIARFGGRFRAQRRVLAGTGNPPE